MDLLKRAKKTINTYRLIKPGDTILIGVSGGADSVALLEILNSLRDEWGLKLIVCHINHGLRKSADTDQRFVERACAKKDILCETLHVSIPEKTNGSLEQAAREKRFSALIRAAKKFKANTIALAHHQNDLAETVLMRIIRGSGLQGLQAILPKRKIDGMVFIRPFVHEKRADIEKFLTSKKISYRNDPTNKNMKFLRNKVRHKLMNCLSTKYNPNIQETLAGLAETSSLDYEFLSGIAEAAFISASVRKSRTSILLNLSKLNKEHPSIRRMIFRKAIHVLKGDTRKITLRHIHQIERLLDNNESIEKPVHLPRNIVVHKSSKTLTFHITRKS